jgi:hypothetical protein
MRLGNQEINRISRTRVVIWNNGDEIDKTHILEEDPLRIAFEKNDHLLQWSVTSASRQQIGLTGIVHQDFDSSLLVDFRFLDSDDGGVLEIIHQGLRAPEVLGTVRGARIISSGSTKLNPDAMAAIAGKPLARRMRHFVNQNGLGISGMSIALFILFFWAIRDVIIPIYFINPERLIEPASYRLNTPIGQVNFVHAVVSTNYYNDISNHALSFAISNKALTLTLILCVMLLAIILAGAYLIHALATRIPDNIALYRPPGNAEEEASASSPGSPSSEHDTS